ncbi:reductive dehalogenase [Dehalogenimonas formicexedens]|uniref:Reductive dehalogenase n=1 Tax=Dehalogenimonas formicexedens TaxID=1839801 RepID=A0A1P8F9Q2_9CHLR|nr:reductive dehalogenase [Dehalogenimonas formicexedens]APV45197.1 reductive dehalogenase [Dehalogenimonas formicexedens]
MSHFHSTVSRRDFMKGLGIAGVGLGSAALASPVFHDLDELAISTSNSTKTYKEWWVKERDLGDPTTEIDWKIYNSYDPKAHPMPLMSGAGANGAMSPANAAARTKRQVDGILNKWPGGTLRDLALDGATGGNYPSIPFDGGNATTPSQRGSGVPAWDGTPEDNLVTLRAAAHFYGSPKAGAMQVTEQTKKFFNNTVTWTNVEKAEQDASGMRIPNKCQWIFAWFTKQNHAMNKLAMRNDPNDPWKNTVFRQGKAGENMAYSHAPQIQNQVMKFIKGLGYQAIKPTASSNVQFGVWSGLVEQGRTAHSCSPEYGLMIRYIDYVVTDLPLTPTKPIDSGVRSFCSECMTCAKVCPSNSLSLEKDTSWDSVDTGNNPGIKTWHMKWKSCAEIGGPFDCVNCQTNCPFDHDNDKASIHNLVRTVQGATPIFNSFFANFERNFDYNGQLSPEVHTDWWYRDLDTWEHDTLLGFGTKGW